MKNAKKITHSTLIDMLLDMEARGGLKNTFIGYTSRTAPKMNKFSRGDMTAEQKAKKWLTNVKEYETGKIDADEFTTRADLLKRAKIKVANPFNNVEKVTTSTARFGVNYSKAVENKAEKITGERVTFEAEKPKGMHFVKLPNGKFSKIILESDTEPGKFYARLTFSANDKPKSVYLADGKEIEKSALVDYLPPTRENFIEVRSVTINNIETLRMNGEEIILK